ncbi:hypothetical protein KIN_08530 [Litoreibacter roseus]|uniref:HTH tetR-type domain-containing protein n=2 Tax=Litoreibacter roseus TaxID=2601869 RepID=A0A6N6JEH4_9RHOB|nr:hypothetical protein KIN_08530 [Litoreibacter roseus]
MKDVAATAGIVKSSLYHHFASKEDLFLSTTSAGYAEHLSRLKRIRGTPDLDPRQRLSDLLDVVYASIVESNIGRMAPMIAETSRLFPQVAEAFHANFIEEMDELLRGCVEDGVARGDYRPLNDPGVDHLFCSPPVSLALSRAMFASFADLDAQFPIAKTKAVHLEIVTRVLIPPAI